MPRFTTAAALALGLAASVKAQSASVTGSVVSVFLLDTDPEALVASLIGSSNSLTTLAVQCAPGVDANSCGYPSPVTVTGGPSTVHASASISGIAAQYGCTLTGTTTGSCSITYVGAASELATDAAGATATGIVTVSTSGTLGPSDIVYYPVTITAGSGIAAVSTAAATASASTVSSGSAKSSAASGSVPAASAASSVTAKSSATGVATSATGVVASASSAASSASKSAVSAVSSSASGAVSTFSAGAAKIVAPGAFAAALLGLAAFL